MLTEEKEDYLKAILANEGDTSFVQIKVISVLKYKTSFS